ncbi:hypothetical protein BDV33DRAFT_210954 [Aspergillus novoparasiticus]|uniref:Uncharacterized protein n=1 Tax=Aspergillus novoparasiticus TaxID=986946 RepID=A0A5N6E6H4_9EURO|nr:hypothetical protein BDV33DRAFT_210954 [Aspergillus novoparasiticus]
MALGAESTYLQTCFQESFLRIGMREVHVEGADVHTVWRIWQLIYLYHYSTDLCPWTMIPETLSGPYLHLQVYLLASCWGLSDELQHKALRSYTDALDRHS